MGSGLLEAYSLQVAFKAIKQGAEQHGMSVWQFIQRGRDPTTTGEAPRRQRVPLVAGAASRRPAAQVISGGWVCSSMAEAASSEPLVGLSPAMCDVAHSDVATRGTALPGVRDFATLAGLRHQAAPTSRVSSALLRERT